MLWRYQVTGVDTVTLYFGDRIDIALVSRIQQAAEALRRRLHGRILDLVPSYTTLLIRYDLRLDDLASLTRDIADTLAELPQSGPGSHRSEVIEIPVFYHPSVGPDLAAVAKRADCRRTKSANATGPRNTTSSPLASLPVSPTWAKCRRRWQHRDSPPPAPRFPQAPWALPIPRRPSTQSTHPAAGT